MLEARLQGSRTWSSTARRPASSSRSSFPRACAGCVSSRSAAGGGNGSDSVVCIGPGFFPTPPCPSYGPGGRGGLGTIASADLRVKPGRRLYVQRRGPRRVADGPAGRRRRLQRRRERRRPDPRPGLQQLPLRRRAAVAAARRTCGRAAARRATCNTLASRLLVAAGGGGGGGRRSRRPSASPASAAPAAASRGESADGSSPDGGAGGPGGSGGTATAGGAPGGPYAAAGSAGAGGRGTEVDEHRRIGRRRGRRRRALRRRWRQRRHRQRHGGCRRRGRLELRPARHALRVRGAPRGRSGADLLPRHEDRAPPLSCGQNLASTAGTVRRSERRGGERCCSSEMDTRPASRAGSTRASPTSRPRPRFYGELFGWELRGPHAGRGARPLLRGARSDGARGRGHRRRRPTACRRCPAGTRTSPSQSADDDGGEGAATPAREVLARAVRRRMTPGARPCSPTRRAPSSYLWEARAPQGRRARQRAGHVELEQPARRSDLEALQGRSTATVFGWEFDDDARSATATR